MFLFSKIFGFERVPFDLTIYCHTRGLATLLRRPCHHVLTVRKKVVDLLFDSERAKYTGGPDLAQARVIAGTAEWPLQIQLPWQQPAKTRAVGRAPYSNDNYMEIM